jgi:hypothetical protein
VRDRWGGPCSWRRCSPFRYSVRALMGEGVPRQSDVYNWGKATVLILHPL